MGKKTPVHVTPRESGWAVTREGAARASTVHRTQAEAEREGRRIAKRDATEFLLHDRSGRIRERDSYGDHPFPPKG